MARPFLKWAGGKTQLLPQLLAEAPQRIATYYEPFLGGGALFFALQKEGRFERAVLSDSNEELINAYIQVRDRVDDLIAAAAVHQRKYRARGEAGRPGYYYAIRGKRPTCPIGRAARTIFLNKTCFNGLYRVNAKGELNVPHGRYANPTICDAEGLRAASEALRGIALEVADFEDAVQTAGAGDFAYFDPPYVPVSETAHFTAYTAAEFGVDDQARLAAAAESARARGACALLSNSGHPDVARLYDGGGFRIATVEAARAINSNPDARGAVREYLISAR